MKVEDKIKEICHKSVKDRENWEHLFLVKMKYGGSVRDYLLSMGAFKDELQIIMEEKLKQIKNGK